MARVKRRRQPSGYQRWLHRRLGQNRGVAGHPLVVVESGDRGVGDAGGVKAMTKLISGRTMAKVKRRRQPSGC